MMAAVFFIGYSTDNSTSFEKVRVGSLAKVCKALVILSLICSVRALTCSGQSQACTGDTDTGGDCEDDGLLAYAAALTPRSYVLAEGTLQHS